MRIGFSISVKGTTDDPAGAEALLDAFLQTLEDAGHDVAQGSLFQDGFERDTHTKRVAARTPAPEPAVEDAVEPMEDAKSAE
jgi:hypothetical protein